MIQTEYRPLTIDFDGHDGPLVCDMSEIVEMEPSLPKPGILNLRSKEG